MIDVIIQVAAVMAAAWLLWKSLSLGLRLIGWALVVLAIINAENAAAMATAVTAFAGVAALVAGHAVFFVRRGYWKPAAMQRLTRSGAYEDTIDHRPPARRTHR